MKQKCGHIMQAAGIVGLFLAAGASDAGAVSVSELAYALLCAGLVFAAGLRMVRAGAAATR